MSGGSCGRLVVALGNPDRGDDGVGPAVVRALGSQPGVEVWEALRGGLPLAEALVGYDRALVVDACPDLPVGELALVSLDGEPGPEGGGGFTGWGLPRGSPSSGRRGSRSPGRGRLRSGSRRTPFGRGLSPEVARAVPRAVAEVRKWLAN